MHAKKFIEKNENFFQKIKIFLFYEETFFKKLQANFKIKIYAIRLYKIFRFFELKESKE